MENNLGTLYPLSTISKVKPPVLGPACTKCKLDKGCESPKIKPNGEGRRKILIVGEAPDKDEDRQGLHFVGKAGDISRRLLLKCGIDMRADCWLTNAVICHPGRFIKDVKCVDYCRPNLIDVLNKYEPNVVIPLGANAVRSVIGHLWKEDPGDIVRWAGFQIPNRYPNCWVCPTIHPYALMMRKNKRGEYKDKGLAEKWTLRHLQAAVNKADSPPWDTVPDYESMVEVVYDTDEAAAVIRGMIGDSPVAIDYETTCLKPEGQHSRIVCCAVSDGERTIAYPWLGEARKATGQLLRSGTPLIASNMSFENSWTVKEFGHPAVGFNRGWDTMLMAHVLDSRSGISSIKFQAYVLLGQEDYNGHIDRFLKSKTGTGYELNQIKQIDKNDLLKYCGMDALLEWLVAKKQADILNVKLMR